MRAFVIGAGQGMSVDGQAEEATIADEPEIEEEAAEVTPEGCGCADDVPTKNIAGDGGTEHDAAESKPAEKPKHPSGVDPDARFAEGLKEKEKGKVAYEKADYEAAIEAWCMARGSFKYIVERKLYEDNEEKLQEVYKLQVLINLNLAQACLKNKEFYQAVTHANKVLEVEPDNTKALYRKASALIDASAFSEAKETLRHLLKVEPGSATAKQMMNDAERKEKASLKSSKKAARKMVANFERDPRAGLTIRESVERRARFLIEAILSFDVDAWVKYYRKELMRLTRPFRACYSTVTGLCRRKEAASSTDEKSEKTGKASAQKGAKEPADKKED